jgi:hypothetical protein
VAFISINLHAADTVPAEVQMPGTQPGEILSPLTPGEPVSSRLSLDPVKQCGWCHGGYNPTVEPLHNWQGSMMSHAARDPLFWGALAIAEQDFAGSGDLCLRCHTSSAWLAGRSVPTDGSALHARDGNGVECETCHRLTNPDGSEHKGVQNHPFVANDGKNPATAFIGTAQYVLWGGLDKLGPYSDSVTKHPSLRSEFHRSPEVCGTCHDVSNPVTGDLAHNNGAMKPLEPGRFSGVLGAPVTEKAAFKNAPYQYGVVERTYSEHKASRWPTLKVSDYPKLPAELQAGAVKAAYEKALLAGTGGNYEDGAPRTFTCQTCHMSPVWEAPASGKPDGARASSTIHNAPKMRKDMAQHDLTGGNYWVPEAIKYLDARGKLRAGGGLTPGQIAAIDAGIVRAKNNLRQAASLKVSGNILRVVNLTGHKLISGYPEGRRMWLNIKWYDAANTLLREDGKYGPITVTINGSPRQVNTIVDLKGTNTRIYEAQGGLTQKWARQLLAMGKPSSLPLSFDRMSGQVTRTLAQLAANADGGYEKTFHFILNNYVISDNRIPPYGMQADEAERRNASPVPDSQYRNADDSATYAYADELGLKPPSGAAKATIELLYQPTSWEYIQFLALANSKSTTFLGAAGDDVLDAWLNTGMAEPYVMAATTWVKP